MEQLLKKKKISIDKRALNEFNAFPINIQADFEYLIKKLEYEGKLLIPEGKKLKNSELFEMRVKLEGAWRGFYAYLGFDEIILLSFFQKKSNTIPFKELKKAINRLKVYKY